MKKPFNVLSTATAMAMLASSALVPVAVSANEASIPAPNSYEVDKVVFKDGDNYAYLTKQDYLFSLDEVKVNIDVIAYDNNQAFSLQDYLFAYSDADGDDKETYQILVNDGSEIKELKEGKITEDGRVVAVDEQPEDRLNETFFYNVA